MHPLRIRFTPLRLLSSSSIHAPVRGLNRAEREAWIVSNPNSVGVHCRLVDGSSNTLRDNRGVCPGADALTKSVKRSVCRANYQFYRPILPIIENAGQYFDERAVPGITLYRRACCNLSAVQPYLRGISRTTKCSINFSISCVRLPACRSSSTSALTTTSVGRYLSHPLFSS